MKITLILVICVLVVVGVFLVQKEFRTKPAIPIHPEPPTRQPKQESAAQKPATASKPPSRYEQWKALRGKRERDWMDKWKKGGYKVLSVEQSRNWMRENGVDLSGIRIIGSNATFAHQVGNAIVASDPNSKYRVILPVD